MKGCSRTITSDGVVAALGQSDMMALLVVPKIHIAALLRLPITIHRLFLVLFLWRRC